MHKEIHKWWSPNLDKDLEIAVYGHYGYALLMFPTAGADFLEYERFQLIEKIAWFIDAGKVKVFSINSINNESWLNRSMYPPHKAIRHQQYNNYITEEVVPFIRNKTSDNTPIITTGASLGAFHALNNLLRRSDLFSGVIAMSGNYDLKYYSGGFFDETCYFNSPVDYLPQWNDEHILNQLRHRSIIIASGQGPYEDPSAAKRMSDILNSKGIQHWLDLWGNDIRHDWPTWRQMLPYFLSKLNPKSV